MPFQAIFSMDRKNYKILQCRLFPLVANKMGDLRFRQVVCTHLTTNTKLKASVVASAKVDLGAEDKEESSSAGDAMSEALSQSEENWQIICKFRIGLFHGKTA